MSGPNSSSVPTIGKADTRVIMTHDMASRSGLFTLSTINEQGLGTCIE
jgi:hypothetical protein